MPKNCIWFFIFSRSFYRFHFFQFHPEYITLVRAVTCKWRKVPRYELNAPHLVCSPIFLYTRIWILFHIIRCSFYIIILLQSSVVRRSFDRPSILLRHRTSLFICFPFQILFSSSPSSFIPTGNPSPNITWTKKFENLPNGKWSVFDSFSCVCVLLSPSFPFAKR